MHWPYPLLTLSFLASAIATIGASMKKFCGPRVSMKSQTPFNPLSGSTERQDFEAEAERRLQHMQQTGEYLTHDDLRGYAMALARGEKPAKPSPRTMTPEDLARFRASMRRTG